MSLDNTENLILNPKFAYFMGYFAADGSYYKSIRSHRFEFSDGNSIPEEIKYSEQFLNDIRELIKVLLGVNVPKLRRRGNRYVLCFTNKKLGTIFREFFSIKPGPKSLLLGIPHIYKDTKLEKFFWLGVMDGDGMIARSSRKIALDMINKNLIYSFNNFLSKYNIIGTLSERKLWECSTYSTKNKSFRVTINAPFFGEYKELLGFYHPRKRLWLERHSKDKHVYIENEIVIPKDFVVNGKMDYSKILTSDRIFVVNGKFLLKKYGIEIRGRDNVKFLKVFDLFKKKGYSKEKIINILSNQRWKMSKGSINSIKLPLYIRDILDMTKVVRMREDSITISRAYTKSIGFDPSIMIKRMERIFDIKPKYTCKGEPIFCSGVLEHLFSKIIKRNTKQYKLPEWHKELEC